MTLGSLVFAAPAALAALVLLPVLWWILRITPPAPRKINFPPVRFLFQLVSREESAATTPLWLILLRLALVLTLVTGAAHPMLNASRLPGAGPIVMVLDDGWAAAKDWTARQTAMEGLIQTAAAAARPVLFVLTARHDPAETEAIPKLLTSLTARDAITGLQPKPWGVDRSAALQDLEKAAGTIDLSDAEFVWLSDGLSEDPESDARFVRGLSQFGSVRVLLPRPQAMPLILRADGASSFNQGIIVDRPASGGNDRVSLRVWAEDGQALFRQEITLSEGETRTAGLIDLPAQWRSRAARIDLAGEDHAAAVLLTDPRWKRRAVGLVTGPGQANDQPFLSAQYYLGKALAPLADVRQGSIPDLMARPLSVLALIDQGRLAPEMTERILNWVRDGGVLVQFAGPRMANASEMGDSLLPVDLRRGDRTIGGALSWELPSTLAPFDEAGPFADLSVPDDVEVHRQVLSEPSQDLSALTWARLTDGTPVVTARREGSGWLILFHTTASPEWSNLVLSGLFVEMLQRVIDLSQGAEPGAADAPLAPVRTLDGFGRPQTPPPSARGISADAFATTQPGPRHPPGLYGTTVATHSLNLSAFVPELQPLNVVGANVSVSHYSVSAILDLRPWLMIAALVLLLLDLTVSLFMRGLLPNPGRAWSRSAVVAGLMMFTVAALPVAASAQIVVDQGTAPPQALHTRLAYVLTGNARDDTVVRAGLNGLTSFVNRRTAVELAEPVGVNPEIDELVFYPFLYWSLAGPVETISAQAADRLTTYLREGGTILFDARRRDEAVTRTKLRVLARRLALPALVPVSAEHLLRRAYYLLPDLPGRWTGRPVWVERSRPDVHDGVSSVVAGSHDWAGAWAIDEATRAPLLPVVPGGERQREIAFRFGLNLVMYVLTGSYKADQVHLPAILERLGR